jgi:hypothetical protein
MKQEELTIGKPKKRRVGRPASSKPTRGRSYTFYEDDINTMLNLGFQPKKVFNEGIKAMTEKYGLDNLCYKEYIQQLETKLQKMVDLLGKIGENS